MKAISYWIIRRIFNFVTYTLIGMKVYGEEHIPAEGPFIIVCNHASYFDPPLLGTAVRHRLIHFMAKEELFRNPIMNWFLRYVHTFPVHRGRIDKKAIVESFRVLKSGGVLGIFPKGRASARAYSGRFTTASPVLPSRQACRSFRQSSSIRESCRRKRDPCRSYSANRSCRRQIKRPIRKRYGNFQKKFGKLS